MIARPHKDSPGKTRPSSPHLTAWRDAAFWSMLLACLGSLAVLSVVADREMMRPLEFLTTHADTPRTLHYLRIELVAEHIRWWILALPLAAILLRWVPLQGNGPGRSAKPKTKGHDDVDKVDSMPSAPGSEARTEATKQIAEGQPPRSVAPSPSRRFSVLCCPPFVLGFFALQLCIGAGFLTGTWTYIRDQFWSLASATEDEIRAEWLPQGVLPVSRRLDRILPPEAKVYVVTDEGEQPVFLNYYLYPRRFYSSETDGGFMEETDKATFWEERRKEGYEWVLLYRPRVDPASGGSLLRLEPTPAASRDMPNPKEGPAAR